MKTTQKPQYNSSMVIHDNDVIHDEDGYHFIVHVEGKGSYDPCAPMCQDDYEYFSGTGQYAESESEKDQSNGGAGLHTTVQVTRGVQNTSGVDSLGCRLGGAIW